MNQRVMGVVAACIILAGVLFVARESGALPGGAIAAIDTSAQASEVADRAGPPPARSQPPTSSPPPSTSPRTPGQTGPAGCGLPSAAFCADFDSLVRNSQGNRNGDLPVTDFSVSRWRSEASRDPGNVEPASIDPCRPGADANPLPPGDVLVCEPSSAIASRHVLVATAQQNYGDTLVRINRPFEFAGRTGTIRFDTNVTTGDLLLGFPVLFFSTDPYSAPSYLDDNSGGATPRDGFTLQFNDECTSAGGRSPRPRLRVFDQHREQEIPTSTSCEPISTADGRLNRVEVRLSRNQIEVWMSDSSPNGVDFGRLRRVFRATPDLGTELGYLSFGVHNHATEKYGGGASWTTLWDNIAFDGVVLAADRVSQVDAAAVPNGPGVDRGHPFDSARRSGPFPLGGVDLDSVEEARLVFNAMVDTITNKNPEEILIRYRLNGGGWRDVRPSASELALISGRAGTFTFSVPVSTTDLRDGANSIEFSGSGIFDGYPSFLGNIDLLVR